MPDTCDVAWHSAGSSNLPRGHDRRGQRSFSKSDKRARAEVDALVSDDEVRSARSGFCGLTRLSAFLRLRRRRLRLRLNAEREDVALRSGAATETKFARERIGHVGNRGGRFLFQRQFPNVAEHVSLQIKLFDGGCERHVNGREFNSTNAFLDARCWIEDRRRARKFNEDVVAAAEIDIAANGKIDILRRGVEKLEHCVIACESEPAARAREIERRALERSIQ